MNTDKNNKETNTSTTLDDERRVKVLSPGMLVTRRFFRNRLAVIGLIIIAAMFIFSFVGGLFAPYGETQVFKFYDIIEKDYAGVAVNNEFQYKEVEGETFPSVARAQLILAINNGDSSFVSKDMTFSLIEEGDQFYRIVQFQDIAKVTNIRGINRISPLGSEEITNEMEIAFEEAMQEGETSFEIDGIIYHINKEGRDTSIAVAKEISLASKKI